MRRLLLFIAMIMVLATVLLGCGEEKKKLLHQNLRNRSKSKRRK